MGRFASPWVREAAEKCIPTRSVGTRAKKEPTMSRDIATLRALAALAAALAAFSAVPSEAAAPPQRVFAVRVGPGVIGVEWEMRTSARVAGFRVYRGATRDGPYEPLADRRPDQPFYLDADVKPSTVYFYTVTSLADDGSPSDRAGPACAWDDDQLLADGSFESEPLGLMDGQPSGWPRRAYNQKTPVVIVPGGPDGSRCVEIRAGDTSISGGLHSGMIPAVEGEVFDQFCWAKSLPGAEPRVGRCFYTEDRRTVEVGKRPYDYTWPAKPRDDGWTPYEGSFTVPETGAYCVLWLIGYRARNTLWFDGARLVDRTSQRVRAFDDEGIRAEVAKMLASSPTARSHHDELEEAQATITECRRRMHQELATLTPREYRRLLVALDRAQQRLADLVWEVKTEGLLLD